MLLGVGLAVVLGAEHLDLLVDRGVEEEREDRRRRAVDRHRHRGRRRDEVEAVVERLHVVERRDRDAGGADLAVDVGAQVGVAAVERHRVERGRQPGGVAVGRQQLEAAVGAERVALAGEHPGGVLAVALEREDAGGEREVPGQVLARASSGTRSPWSVCRGRLTRADLGAGERLAGQRGVVCRSRGCARRARHRSRSRRPRASPRSARRPRAGAACGRPRGARPTSPARCRLSQSKARATASRRCRPARPWRPGRRSSRGRPRTASVISAR